MPLTYQESFYRMEQTQLNLETQEFYTKFRFNKEYIPPFVLINPEKFRPSFL